MLVEVLGPAEAEEDVLRCPMISLRAPVTLANVFAACRTVVRPSRIIVLRRPVSSVASRAFEEEAPIRYTHLQYIFLLLHYVLRSKLS